MQKIFYGDIYLEENVLKENGIYYPIKLEYYKTKEENTIQEESEIYGIEVIKKSYITSEKIEEEKSSIKFISENEKTADHLLDILKTNEVPPVHTKEIIENLMRERLS